MNRGKGHKPIAASARHVGRTAWIGGGMGLAAAVAVGVAVFAGRADEAATPSATARGSTKSHLGTSALPIVDVYKSPTCGCCANWVDHLREAGFEVRTTDMRDLTDFKASQSVPRHVESCHTALVDGYVVEGHVPASDIQRLLRERPAITGVAVPGMPIGSPGMEVPGTRGQPYDVIAFDENGHTDVFASHGR
jgi:hypothetical protein